MGQFLGRQARAARSQTIGEMNIVWSPEAIEDLASLRAYIAEDNPAAARRTVRHIIESIEQLIPDNPRIGRAGRVPGTRELVIPRSRDVGLTVFDPAGSLGRRKPRTLVELGLRIMG